MNVKTAVLGVAVYLTPDGPLTGDNIEVLDRTVQQAREEGSVNIVIDLSRVPLFDSRGLEFLWDLASDLRKAGGSLRLAGGNAICTDILAITKLDQIVLMFDDMESAGRSFL